MEKKMERPVTLKFKSSHRTSTRISERFLKNVRYKVNYGEKELIRLKEGTIYSQRYSHFLFFVEILEFRLTKDLDMSYQIKDPALFLFFMLHGHVSFTAADGKPIADAGKGICYPTYNQCGEFYVHFPKGIHRLFYISAKAGWLNNHLDTYPCFREFMASFYQNTDLYGHLPQYPITKGMRKFLRELYKINPNSARNLEVRITDSCMGLFEEYHQLLASKVKNINLKDIVAVVKAHLDTHFTEHDADNISKPLQNIPLTERTVRQAFHEETNYTIHDYIELLRVTYAHELLQKTALSVKEIGLKTGFKRHSYFTFVYKKHFNYLPKSARK